METNKYRGSARRVHAPKLIAFFLPQFHPIPENSQWWGPGFSEWHNVAKARPLFRGHLQPRLPGELGFYDLRLSETREAQAQLASNYGVSGFCYWHYWFAGKQLLERPISDVLRSGKPQFPFCIAWANETWTGVWHGNPKRVLVEQTYPENDAMGHYAYLRTLFHDERYIKHDGRPMLYVYRPKAIPISYIERLREYAVKDGFPDLYVVGTWSPNPSGAFSRTEDIGLDAAVITNLTGRDSFSRSQWLGAVAEKIRYVVGGAYGPKRLAYRSVVPAMVPVLERFGFEAYNCVVSNWDNTPRSGRRGLVLTEWSPEVFGDALRRAYANTRSRYADSEKPRYVFLKSWNEWAEGNYVEPDQQYGRSLLEQIREAVRQPLPNAAERVGG